MAETLTYNPDKSAFQFFMNLRSNINPTLKKASADLNSFYKDFSVTLEKISGKRGMFGTLLGGPEAGKKGLSFISKMFSSYLSPYKDFINDIKKENEQLYKSVKNLMMEIPPPGGLKAYSDEIDKFSNITKQFGESFQLLGKEISDTIPPAGGLKEFLEGMGKFENGITGVGENFNNLKKMVEGQFKVSEIDMDQFFKDIAEGNTDFVKEFEKMGVESAEILFKSFKGNTALEELFEKSGKAMEESLTNLKGNIDPNVQTVAMDVLGTISGGVNKVNKDFGKLSKTTQEKVSTEMGKLGDISVRSAGDLFKMGGTINEVSESLTRMRLAGELGEGQLAKMVDHLVPELLKFAKVLVQPAVLLSVVMIAAIYKVIDAYAKYEEEIDKMIIQNSSLLTTMEGNIDSYALLTSVMIGLGSVYGDAANEVLGVTTQFGKGIKEARKYADTGLYLSTVLGVGATDAANFAFELDKVTGIKKEGLIDLAATISSVAAHSSLTTDELFGMREGVMEATNSYRIFTDDVSKGSDAQLTAMKTMYQMAGALKSLDLDYQSVSDSMADMSSEFDDKSVQLRATIRSVMGLSREQMDQLRYDPSKAMEFGMTIIQTQREILSKGLEGLSKNSVEYRRRLEVNRGILESMTGITMDTTKASKLLAKSQWEIAKAMREQEKFAQGKEALDKVHQEMMNNINKVWDQFKNILSYVMVIIGQRLFKVLKPVLNILVEVFKVIGGWLEKLAKADNWFIDVVIWFSVLVAALVSLQGVVMVTKGIFALFGGVLKMLNITTSLSIKKTWGYIAVQKVLAAGTWLLNLSQKALAVTQSMLGFSLKLVDKALFKVMKSTNSTRIGTFLLNVAQKVLYGTSLLLVGAINLVRKAQDVLSSGIIKQTAIRWYSIVADKAYAAGQTIVAAKTGLVVAATWAMNAAFLANPITWIVVGIVAAIALIGLAIYSVIKYWGDLVGAFWYVYDVIKSIAVGYFMIITWPFRKAYELITGLFKGNSPGGLFEGFLDYVSGIFSKIWDIITWPMRKIAEFIGNIFGGIFDGFIDNIVGVFSKVWNVVTQPFKDAYDWIVGLFVGHSPGGLFEDFVGYLKGFGKWIIGIFKGIGKAISKILSEPLKLITKLFENIGGILKNVISTLVKALFWPVNKMIEGALLLFGGGESKSSKEIGLSNIKDVLIDQTSQLVAAITQMPRLAANSESVFRAKPLVPSMAPVPAMAAAMGPVIVEGISPGAVTVEGVPGTAPEVSTQVNIRQEEVVEAINRLIAVVKGNGGKSKPMRKVSFSPELQEMRKVG